jgi:hypothetical protein
LFTCSSGYTSTVTYTCGSEGFTTLDACSAVICDGSNCGELAQSVGQPMIHCKLI